LSSSAGEDSCGLGSESRARSALVRPWRLSSMVAPFTLMNSSAMRSAKQEGVRIDNLLKIVNVCMLLLYANTWD